MFDFNALPKDLKNMLINIFLLPFWYIVIYLFAPNLYESQEIILITSICISLTVVSSILSATMATIIEQDLNNSVFDFENVILAFIAEILVMSFLLLVGYLVKRFTNYMFDLYGFALTFFALIVIFFSILRQDEKSTPDK